MARILVVDDSLAAARSLSRLVEASGDHEVLAHAVNGAEAIKYFATEKPDLVLMDIVMPILDGLQALRAILSRDAEARVIMISSVGGVGEKVNEALRQGARAVISKPFEKDEVLSAIAQALAEK